MKEIVRFEARGDDQEPVKSVDKEDVREVESFVAPWQGILQRNEPGCQALEFLF